MIDFKKYRNPEIITNISDIMDPSCFFVKLAIWGGIFTIIGIIADILLIKSSDQEVIIHALTSVILLFLMIFSGVLLGTHAYFRQLNHSMQNVLDYTNNVVHQVIQDVSQSIDMVKSSTENCRITLPGGNEIVSGVLLDVINPAVKNCFENKLPLIGKLIFKIYSTITTGLLKMSSIFFAKVDKQIDDAINGQFSKVKNVAERPLNFIESTWLPKIKDGTEKYIGKAKNYIKRVFFFVSLPVLFFAIAFIAASASLMYFAM